MEKHEIEKLRDLPIEEVAEYLGMQPDTHHKALCPLHDDHHASLSFNRRKNNCRCFVCMDRSLGTIDLVMKVLHVDFPRACWWLADRFGISLQGRKPAWGGSQQTANRPLGTASTKGEATPRRGEATSPPSFDASRYARFFEHPWLGDEARRFLFEERGLDERVVRWCRLSSWQDREGTHWLQIPYFDTEGKLIGMQNRNLDHGKPRFRFPYGAKCGIYNLPVIGRMKSGDDLYITEGCSDCWAMLSAGHKAIAIPSATLLTPDDKELLASLSRRLAISWHMYPDRDAPGERLLLQLQELLPSLRHHQLPPDCKDFAEAFLKGSLDLPRPSIVFTTPSVPLIGDRNLARRGSTSYPKAP